MPPPTPPSVNDGRMTSGNPSVAGQLVGFGEVAGETALRDLEADLPHRVLEQLTILGDLDGFDRGADQLHVVLLENAGLREVDRQIERGLAADRRQHGVGPLARDNRLHDLHREGLDVRAVGQLGVGHDGRRVAVDQHDLEALGAQGLARLRSRVIELTGLTDDDRSGSDHQTRFKSVLRGIVSVYSCRCSGLRALGLKAWGLGLGLALSPAA